MLIDCKKEKKEEDNVFQSSCNDFVATFHKKWDMQQKDILTHCRRELRHAVWNLLLDDAFIYVFKYGIVIKCSDGVERRVYPWFFTYSANYPEKCVFLPLFPYSY